ncbi:MAG: sulfatase-like hydrolase/transferase [Planctomycetota bacterium]|nr:sulfatase-like hydrolase/transferase [Planctomycetota bacterium]MDA1163787.1 sulfatase-like hydrolase/transferase [Planctomycetota bacterium]
MRLLVPICTLLLLASHAAVTAAELPNIVLCMADDQGWGDVGYYGKSPVKTPVLDKMAATGLRFDRFYAAAPVCSPTRASVLTGRHPNRSAVFKWGHPIRPQETTIAEALKKAGYVTGHFGKWHLGSCRADSPVCPGNSGFDEWLSAPNFYENDPLMSHNGNVIQTKGESSQVPVDFALNFMKNAKQQGKPFIAVVWFGSPHAPHIASEKFLDMYKGFPKAHANFLGEVSGIDAAVGNLRTSIREMGIADNTLLWYTSDNGALPKVGSTGGLSGNKGNLLEGGIRVPAIIEWPAVVKRHRKIDIVCNTTDIYPTLLALTGVTVEHQPVLDGRSILPLIRDEPFADRREYGFWDYPIGGRGMKADTMLAAQKAEADSGKQKPWNEVEPDPSVVGGYSEDNLPGPAAWIDGNFKLHRTVSKTGEAGARYQLFDLGSDVEEKHDLSETQPERLAGMKQKLSDWQMSVVRSLNGEDYNAK